MKNAVIDFETYYDKEISVTTLGTPNYVAATDAYIVGITIGEEVWCGTLPEMRETMNQMAADETIQPIAANANFDQAWWGKYAPAFNKDWICVLDVGAFNQYPRNLAQLGGTVLGTKVDKAKRDEMKGVRYEDLSEVEQKEMQEYCANDCVVELQVYEKMPPMTPFEAKVAAHTRMINRRGVHIDLELVDADKTKLEQMRFDAFKSIPWSRDEAPLSYPALVKYCNFKSIPVPKSTAKTSDECDEFMEVSPELNEVIGSMRRFRKANTMLKKCETLKRRVTSEGILPMDLLYCGAPHTRRWSSKGFNVQNLDKEPLKTGVGEEAVWTRNWLIPRPGHIFYIVDLAQIEPRCLNWMVGNEAMMTALRCGFSYYEAYVTASGQALRVGWSGRSGTLKKELGTSKYTKVKNESLGCGYGMGATKYQTYANVGADEAKRVVAGFRASNPRVVSFWRRLDSLIAQASRDKEKHLAMEMPTGEPLQYFNVRSHTGGYEGFVTKGDFGALSRQPRLWGGTLAENVTQRMARDVLANALITAEEAGHCVRLHVHDEGVFEVPVVGKEKAAADIDRIMCTPPEWAPDLPLGAEGAFASCYTK